MEITDLLDKIKKLEAELQTAQQSGDEATQALRDQIRRLTEELEALKVKSQREYLELEDRLTKKHAVEMEAQKQKYEQIIGEIKMNSNNDKEFL